MIYDFDLGLFDFTFFTVATNMLTNSSASFIKLPVN